MSMKPLGDVAYSAPGGPAAAYDVDGVVLVKND